jgi:serine/threonine protein kinase
MAIEAGRLLNQRYRLIRPVGQGSQASVWVAEHLALQTHVAVKLIDPELAKKETARERFRREATAAAQLRSAHVVQILDHGIDGDQPFIVMELLDGEDLFERLAHRGRLSLRETSKIVTQVARALSRAHGAGIVHRDLKPENVFLVPNEDDEVVKVLDFGVAKVKNAAKAEMKATGVGTLIGTPHYMSPEQVKGIVEVDYRTDLWALGVITFQCVAGELPFDSEGVGDLLIKITIGEIPVPSRIYPPIPPAFDAWFAKACAREAAARFQSAREMALALAGVVGAVDGVMPRAPTVRPPAAALPQVGRIPAPPRMPTAEHLGSEELEEVDPFDEDEAPTRMKAPPAAVARSTPPNPFLPGAPSAPRPAAGKPAISAPPPAPAHEARSVPVPVPPPAPPSHNGAPSAAGAKQASAPPPVASVQVRPVEQADSHDIVDFDETIPAVDGLASFPLLAQAAAQAQGKPVLALLPGSEPPPPPSTPPAAMRPAASPPPAPPPPAPPNRVPVELSPRAVIAPVAVAAPRQAMPPPPSPEAVPPSIPRSSPAGAISARPPVSSVPRPVERAESASRTDQILTEPPPELDGNSKRRRLVRFLVAGVVLLVAGLAYTVVRSQIIEYGPDPSGATSASPTAPPAPPPPPPAPDTQTPSSQPAPITPGHVTHPGKPTPTTAPRGPFRPRPKPSPDSIDIPEPPPDDNSVPAAP